MEASNRRSVLRSLGGAAVLTALAGCLGLTGDGGTSDPTGSGGSAGADNSTAAPTPTPTPGLDAVPTRASSLPLHYSLEHIRDRVTSGGPGKDGIPSIDDPVFESVDAASEWLDPGDVVFGVVRGDDVRAYPQRILVWHEIVNDVLDGDPVSVTYCPLTGTALGFERGSTTFGVSGDLVNSNLVMYDRATDSRWPQVMATAIEGPFEGRSLRQFPVTWTTFERWRTAHPDSEYLSRRTGSIRNYDNDPYGAYNPPRGYYVNTHTLFPPLTRDGPTTYDPKRVVVGVREPDGVVGFLKERAAGRGVLRAAVDDTEFVAVYDPSLDAVRTYRNRDGRRVETGMDGVVVVDDEAFAPGELPLDPVVGFDAMWFAWTRIYPETVIVD